MASVLYATPPCFAKYAAVETEFQLMDRYGFSKETVRRIRRELGIPARVYKTTTPPDFAEKAKTKTLPQLMSHYGLGCYVVKRMLKEAGVERKPHDGVPWNKRKKDAYAPIIKERDMSEVARAVDYLRRYGPVSRKGNMWMRGNTRLDDQQIIERAKQKGWKG